MQITLSDNTTYDLRVIQDAHFDRYNDTLTIRTALPDRGLGVPTDAIVRAFKAEVLDLIRRYGDDLRGATVRLSGPNVVANAAFAGFAFGKVGAHRIEQEQQGGVWVLVAAHDDPDAPVPLAWEPGMWVKARLFGHVAEVKIIGIGTGYRGRRRVQVKANGQSAWIDAEDVLEFVRYD